MTLGEFLSPEAGQRRTRALHEFLNDDVAHYVPPNLREVLGLAAEMNPVNDIYEAGGDLRDGDYIGAATNTAAAALPLAGAVAARPLASGLAQTGDDASRAIVDALTMYQAGGRQAAGDFIADESGALRLYHGSPHDFDRFSMDAIGTGEGAQAYGHGLYFAESEDVARQYRDALSAGQDGPEYTAARILALKGGDEAQAIDHVTRRIDEAYERGDIDSARRSQAIKAAILDGRAAKATPDGRLYEVNVNANPEDFLDWDAPLSEQPEGVRQWFDSRGISDGFAGQQSGNELFQAERRALGDKALAGSMKEAGVAGVKYLDHGSRFNAMDGLGPETNTRNYVIFDENLIEIVRKYGIAGAAAMLGMSASDLQAQIGQQDNMSGLLGMPTESALRDYLNQ